MSFTVNGAGASRFFAPKPSVTKALGGNAVQRKSSKNSPAIAALPPYSTHGALPAHPSRLPLGPAARRSGGVLGFHTAGRIVVSFAEPLSSPESNNPLENMGKQVTGAVSSAAEGVSELVSGPGGPLEGAKEAAEQGIDAMTAGTPLDQVKGRGTQAVLEQGVMNEPDGHPGPHPVGEYLYHQGGRESEQAPQ